ncbi:MobF family relaxase [Streptomyces sp. NPDC006992]|uniref:MobF family relaxase n=1 Tax=Streptomyces sp. NPDC006992 TaxID=3155601 RepID=UPI0033D7C976
MAWLTRITADEQVEYRLREQAGCGVVEAAREETVVREGAERDAQVDYRLRAEGDGVLVWVGRGLREVGIEPGARLCEDDKDAARRIMAGCHPATGARLAGAATSARAHPDAQLTTARLVEAVEAAAAERGVEPEELLEGKPKQQKTLERMQRMVHRRGEAHRSLLEPLHKLARAAGVDLAEVYGTEELERARANADKRLDDRVRGWDLVLDLPKSDSVLAGLMDREREEVYRRLVAQAVDETVAQLEAWVGYAVGSEDGQPVRLATGGLVGWRVEHRAARPVVAGEPGDPHLHLHVTIANMGRCQDGKWRSIANSGQDLHRHAKAADAFFKARVRHLSAQRFGVRREYEERSRSWEVYGVPEELRDSFSRRAAAVVEEAGQDAEREEMQRVSGRQRRAKVDADARMMRDSWRQRAEQLVDVDEMVARAAPGPEGFDGGAGSGGGRGPVIPPPERLAAAVFDPETGLTSGEKSFSRAQLLAAVGEALGEGLDVAEPGRLDELADQVLAVEGYAVPLPHIGSLVMSSTDRYTTRDVLDAEDVAVRQARARYDTGVAQLTFGQAEAARDVFEVANGFELSAEQRAAVDRALTGGHGVETLVGVAGAGKSTLMEACRIGWDASGLTYAGATLAAVAAQQLEGASGIPARTVASWLRRIDSGEGLSGIDVLVVDEATMVDDRSAAVLLAEAERTGTKLLAIGDPLQMQAVGVGGWFAEAHRLVEGLELRENRRQEDEAEQAALEVWRTGDHEQALELLADRGRVHAAETAQEAHSQILTTWDEVRGRWKDPHERLESVVVLAARNTDVNVLNAGAQQIRRAAGELGAEHTYALPGGGDLTLAEGDVVRVRVNDYRSKRGEGPDVLNGYRGIITAVDGERRVEVTWRRRDRTQEDGWRYESAWMAPEQIASGALQLGYAMTVAASQGMSTQVGLLYGHGSNAFSTYPGLTRGRQENHLWLPLAVVEDEDTQNRLGAARSEKERLQRAMGAFARFLGQSRPDRMVSDQLRTPPEPAAPRHVEAATPHHGEAEAAATPQQIEAEAAAEEDLQEHERHRAAAVSRSTTVPAARTGRRVEESAAARLEELRESLAARQSQQQEREALAAQIPSWLQRPYGKRSTAQLRTSISRAETMAQTASEQALDSAQQAEELSARLERERTSGTTSGQRYAAGAAAILDRAQEHLQDARRHYTRGEQARAAAEQAGEALERLAANRDKSRLTLRLAGTSRREHRELTHYWTQQEAAARTEAAEAFQAADSGRQAAWETVRASPYAGAWRQQGAEKPAPQTLEQAGAGLEAMRRHLPEMAQRIDRADLQRLARLTGQSQQHQQRADECHTRADHLRTEQELRDQLAQTAPERHQAETAGRRAHLQKRTAEQRARLAADEEIARQQRQPPQHHRGPGMEL